MKLKVEIVLNNEDRMLIAKQLGLKKPGPASRDFCRDFVTTAIDNLLTIWRDEDAKTEGNSEEEGSKAPKGKG